MSTRRLTIALALCCSVSSPAQTLVRDINQGPPPPPQDTGSSRLLRAAGNCVFFARATRNEAFELWRSDGTANGTALVADVCPGECSGILDAEVLGARIFFVGFDAAIGGVRELYVSDGTTNGTARVASSIPFVDPAHMRAVNGAVLFVATSAGHGNELWRSDGTAAGTALVSDIYPGAISSDPRPMLVSNGVLYFTALHPLYGREVWRSDGTPAGTRLFAETVPGLGAAFEFDQMLEIGGVVYFGADVAPAGYELWRSDGTAAGTRLLFDVNPGASASYPSHFVALNGNLLFTAYEPIAGRELWISDGTPAGTRLLADLQPGSGSSNPGGLARLGSEVLFAATTPSAGTELWASDGTAAGSRLLRDLAPGGASSNPSNLVAFNNGLVFNADDGARGDEPWFTDGTAAGTRLLADVAPGLATSRPSKAVATTAGAFFFAFDPTAGRELWRTDGTTAARVADVESDDVGSYPRVVLEAGTHAYYAARRNGNDDELWRTDGTAAGTARVPDPAGGVLGPLASGGLTQFFAAAHGDAIYFVAAGSVGATSYERALWRFDAATNVTALAFGQAQTGMVAPAVGAVASLERGVLFALLDDRDGRRKLMLYEPSTNSTRTLFDFGAGSDFDFPAGEAAFARVGDVIYFRGDTAATGGELWRSDGTAAGTFLVRDLALGSSDAHPQWLTAHEGVLLFACRSLPGLFRSDGTAAGTTLVRALTLASPLATGGGMVVFFADDGATGAEPWASDGTLANTVRLADIAPGSASSGGAGAPLFAGGTFFWLARAPSTGFELWRSDGTPSGTALVRDVNPGARPGTVWSASQSMFPPVAVGSGSLVLFAGAEPLTGVELWRSNGTSSGTVRVSDLRAGPASSTPRAFARAGRRTLLSIDDGTRGHELFAIDLAALGGVLAAPYGAGCAGTLGRVPRIEPQGLPTLATPAFAVRLTRARPQSACALLLNGQRATQALGGGCTLLVHNPLVAFTATTDLAGTALAPLPIPNVPQLAGVEVFTQFAVVDPAGAFLGLAAFSDGLHLVISR